MSEKSESTERDAALLADAAATLVGLGPQDAEEIEQLAGALQELTESEWLPEQARASARLAADSLTRALSLEVGDRDESLAAACEALEGGLSALEDQTLDLEPAAPAREDVGPQPVATKQPSSEEPARFRFAGPAVLPDDADEDLLADYIVECLEQLGMAETSLLELEAHPDETEALNTIFRAFHTVKGTSGFLGLDRIQRLAHLAESLLDRARTGEIQITGSYADLTLEACDTLQTLVEGLRGLAPGGATPIPESFEELLGRLGGSTEIVERTGLEEPPSLGEILIDGGVVEPAAVARALEEQRLGDPRRIGEVLVEQAGVPPRAVKQALKLQAKTQATTATEQTVRVGTGRLDSLADMVGELVIAQSMIAQDPDAMSQQRPQLAVKVAHLGKITRELQDLAMALRMVPLKPTFEKMRRVLRDLARKSGKSVELVTEGEDTEIDRNMVEVMNDPLVHMVRNSVDHGIEPLAERLEKGKPETGTVSLHAYHSAGNVVIEIRDDGRGLDRDKLVNKAVERGLIESGDGMTDREVFELVFHPGFSTAAKVTDVSGRGVGMDVVKRGVEQVRGRVEVSSELGKGSVFGIRLPLTMAITDAMLVTVGSERYLLPTVSIQRSFKPEASKVSTVADRGEMVLIQDDLVPIVRLHQLFQVPDAVTDLQEGLLVAIESQGGRCTVLVDEILGKQQVVIKSLGRKMGNLPGISGGAILGDGRVGIILDAHGILNLSRRNGDARLQGQGSNGAAVEAEGEEGAEACQS